jgi:hypothetical protein
MLVDAAVEDLRGCVIPLFKSPVMASSDQRSSDDYHLLTEGKQAWHGVLKDPFGSRLILRFSLLRGLLRGLQGPKKMAVELVGWPQALPELPVCLGDGAECVQRHANALLDACLRAWPRPLSAAVPMAGVRGV